MSKSKVAYQPIVDDKNVGVGAQIVGKPSQLIEAALIAKAQAQTPAGLGSISASCTQ